MPWCPKARKRPVSGKTNGPMYDQSPAPGIQVLGAVLHVNVSDGNLYNWVAGDHDMSCHFEVYKDGSAEQYLDTNASSWCQVDGNNTYLSIETEGFPNEPLTPAQLETTAQIVAWCARMHGFPLRVADSVGERGLGWHGMGGAAWGGHTGCPGDKRKAQRAEIIARAKEINNPPKGLSMEDKARLDKLEKDFNRLLELIQAVGQAVQDNTSVATAVKEIRKD
jgi:hypothetical protein